MSGGMYGAGDPVPSAHDLAGGGRPEDGDVASSTGRERARDEAARLVGRLTPDAGASFASWLDGGAATEAGAARARVAALQAQATGAATLAGAFVAAAERGLAVTVTTVDGATVHGVVVGVGRDVVAIARDAATEGPTSLVPLGAVAALRGEDARPAGRARAAHRSSASNGLALADVLADLAADRERVAVRVRGAGVLRGRLGRAGADACELHLDGGGPTGTQVVVTIDAVTEVVLLER